MEISDLGESRKQVVVPTRERIGERLQSGMLMLKSEKKKE